MEAVREPGSFRDPSGFIFEREDVLYRQVNERYAGDYDHLMESGLYERLVASGLLVSHEEVARSLAPDPGAHKVLRPARIPFISYPYEWCFSQLRKAALATLEIQRIALEHEMVLKDASAFNIQFVGTRPVLIDTLSFERYDEGTPWVAYHQFCRHFLAPLELMARTDVRLSRLFASFLEGIPLGLASRLLPKRSWASLGCLVHLHLHARSVTRFSDSRGERTPKRRRVSRRGLEGIIASLESSARKAGWNRQPTEWADYEESHAYADESRATKELVVREYLARLKPRVVWDLGSNTGAFSRMAASEAELVVSLDSDPGAVEKNFGALEDGGPSSVLPLCVDLANPTPGLGWGGAERLPLVDRGPADALLALALVHHLAIGGNVPFELLAEGFSRMGSSLVIEFVPKDDPQVKRLLRSREDIFDAYTEANFRDRFSVHFAILDRRPLPESGRVLYLMSRRSDVGRADTESADQRPGWRRV